MSNTLLVESGGFSDSHFTENMFTHASGDYPTYSFVDPMKPLELDDPPLKFFRDSLWYWALQISLMVMLGSHIPDET